MNRGAYGEALAAQLLEKKGFRTVARNFRTRQGEIDLIAENERFLLFVEVKLRKSDRFGAACEAVTPAKQRRLIAAAEAWLTQHETALQPRFDIVEIYLPEGAATPSRMNHLENAFET